MLAAYASSGRLLPRPDASSCPGYPFLDVGDHGYGTVAVNIVLVAVLFLAVAGVALGVDRFLPGVRATDPPGARPTA